MSTLPYNEIPDPNWPYGDEDPHEEITEEDADEYCRKFHSES